MLDMTKLTLLAALACTTTASAQTVYSTDFTTLDGWTVETPCMGIDPTPMWAADATPATASGSFVSGPHSLNFNNGVDYGGNSGPFGPEACGSATSPVIDLSGAPGVNVRFMVKAHVEADLFYDAVLFEVRSEAATQSFYFTNLREEPGLGVDWSEVMIPLDPSWGRVTFTFDFQSADGANNQFEGAFVDDFEVSRPCTGGSSLLCEGQTQASSGVRARLTSPGNFSIRANQLRIVGEDFPMDQFASLFAGPMTATLPVGNGIRCIGAPQSVRLDVAPTRFGSPWWRVDLQSAPLAGSLAFPGSTLHFQTIFRDGASVNFSDAVSVLFCQ